MLAYRPVGYSRRIGQAVPSVAPAAPAPVTPSAPVPVYGGYTGVPGILETVGVLGIVGSAAWIGVRTATSKQSNKYVKVAGWVGGVGSGVLGLLYLGQKTGMSMGLPKVQVTA